MRAARFVFVHSPLVGPSTWMPVAEVLTSQGHPVTVASLVGIADAPAPRWRWAVNAAVADVPDTGDALVLVGHSGAGLLLPAIGDALGERVRAYLFVDAVPPTHAEAIDVASLWLRDLVRKLADDGRVPPWSRWWGDQGMTGMVPDPDMRDRLEADMPFLPLDFFDERVSVPPGWVDTPSAMLQFSPGYDEAAQEARSQGLLVDRMPCGHLHMVVEPLAVARWITEICVLCDL